MESRGCSGLQSGSESCKRSRGRTLTPFLKYMEECDNKILELEGYIERELSKGDKQDRLAIKAWRNQRQAQKTRKQQREKEESAQVRLRFLISLLPVSINREKVERIFFDTNQTDEEFKRYIINKLA